MKRMLLDYKDQVGKQQGAGGESFSCRWLEFASVSATTEVNSVESVALSTENYGVCQAAINKSVYHFQSFDLNKYKMWFSNCLIDSGIFNSLFYSYDCQLNYRINST